MSISHDWSTDYRHPTAWDQPFAPLSLPEMLAASATRKGDAPMLDFMGRRFSYAEVAEGVFPLLRPSVRIEPASFGAQAGLTGAATVALDAFFYDLEPNKRRSEATASALPV